MEEYNKNEFEKNTTDNANENPSVNKSGEKSPYSDINPNENPSPYVTNYNPYTSDYKPGQSDNSYISSSYVNYETEKRDKKGLGIAGMILGILSIVLCCIWYVALPAAIVGLVLSCISQKAKGNGCAIAGIILCSFALAFALLMFILALSMLGSFFEEFMNALNSALDSSNGSYPGGGDSSSFDHNNGAIINIFNFLKGIFVR